MPRTKRARSESVVDPPSPCKDARNGLAAKKLKLLDAHTLASPFPTFTRPTPSEAHSLLTLLTTTHPSIPLTPRTTPTSNPAESCGATPNVLASLIGTILSQNTTGRNAATAQRALDSAFGMHNFTAMANAPHAALAATIRPAGLASQKARAIQGALRATYSSHGVYSLQHLSALSDADAMRELVAFDGVGPKTAGCVLLFSLGRQVFPVDTHVFRAVRMLGWVPPRASRGQAQAHLEVRLPGEVKFALHVLLVEHGRRCGGCKSGRGKCPLKEWVKAREGLDEEGLETMDVKEEEEEAVKLEAGQESFTKVAAEASQPKLLAPNNPPLADVA